MYVYFLQIKEKYGKIYSMIHTNHQGLVDLGDPNEQRKVKFLSREAIARIRETEIEAGKIRANAEEEARRTISATEKSCAVNAACATAAAESELRENLDVVRSRADALIEESREEAREGTADMEAAARAHMRDAVKLIVWEIYDSCQ